MNYNEFIWEWTELDDNFVFAATQKTFSTSGVKNITDNESIFAIFSKFFNKQLMDDFIEEMNIILLNCWRNEKPLKTTPHLIYGFLL